MHMYTHILIYLHTLTFTHFQSCALINVKGEMPLLSPLEFGCVVAAVRFLGTGLGLGAMGLLPRSPVDPPLIKMALQKWPSLGL